MTLIQGNIRFLRKESGLTQRETSSRLAIPLTTYASYEYGKAEPSADVIIKICSFFKIDSTVFITTDLSNGNLINKNERQKNNTEGNLTGNPIGNLNAKNYNNPIQATIISEEHSTYEKGTRTVPKIDHIDPYAALKDVAASLRKKTKENASKSGHESVNLESSKLDLSMIPEAVVIKVLEIIAAKDEQLKSKDEMLYKLIESNILLSTSQATNSKNN